MNVRKSTQSKSLATMKLRILTLAWIVLLGLTAGSFWIAEGAGDSKSSTAFAVLGFATLKAHLVAGLFMEMIHAPRIWAVAMSAFLSTLGGALIVLFL